MSMNNFDGRLGRTIFTFALVGTLGAFMLMAPKLQTSHRGKVVNNGSFNGAYSDEDVKKRRDELMRGISSGSKDAVKTYGKKKEIVPKSIKK